VTGEPNQTEADVIRGYGETRGDWIGLGPVDAGDVRTAAVACGYVVDGPWTRGQVRKLVVELERIARQRRPRFLVGYATSFIPSGAHPAAAGTSGFAAQPVMPTPSIRWRYVDGSLIEVPGDDEPEADQIEDGEFESSPSEGPLPAPALILDTGGAMDNLDDALREFKRLVDASIDSHALNAGSLIRQGGGTVPEAAARLGVAERTLQDFRARLRDRGLDPDTLHRASGVQKQGNRRTR